MIQKNRSLIIINIFILGLFVGFLTYVTLKYVPGIVHFIKEPDQFRKLLTSYGPISILVFMFFQILQVIIAAIPGELVQLAGGYVYGTFFGTVYSSVGILLGTVIAFYISRLLGYRLVKNLVSPESLAKFNFLMNNPKSEITLFMLFLIPGIPKDILVYTAGFTPIKPSNFFFIVTLARIPGILASSFVGANFQERDYYSVVVVSIIASILFVIGILNKDYIIARVHLLLHKEAKEQKPNLE